MDGFYLNIKHRDKSSYKAPIKEVFENLLNMEIEGFSINSNDNNIAIIPNFLNKEMAIEYIIEKFMQKSHYLIIPSNSQINTHLKTNI